MAKFGGSRRGGGGQDREGRSVEDVREPAGKVTIRTVARDAGVSVAAVSKVLRNAYGVSDALRERVQASIARLGYRPSTAARGMRGRTYTVGVLMVELRNPFVPDIVDGANVALSRASFKALIGVGRSEVALEAGLIESMIDHNMDGLILVAPRLLPEVIRRYAGSIPIVVIRYHLPGETSFDTVNADDRRGAELAVEELVRAGHAEIGMLSLADRFEAHVAVQREAGYRRAMEAAGLGDRARVTRVPAEAGERRRALAAWLEAPDRPAAVFCWSDLTAIELLGVARDRGLEVPRDLAVVGFDNSSVAALPQIGLTSIDQAGTDLGATAAEVLLERIKGRSEPRHALLEPRLVRRFSVA
jgi:LacI family transcriptional regulator